MFRIPFAQTSLIHDRLSIPTFRSTRPGYFCCDLPCTQTFRKHNDRERAPSTRGDLYRTCTPNLIHNDRVPSNSKSNFKNQPIDRPRQLQQRHLPLTTVSRVCLDTNQSNQLVQSSELRHALPFPHYFRVINTLHVRPIFQGSCCNPDFRVLADCTSNNVVHGDSPGASSH